MQLKLRLGSEGRLAKHDLKEMDIFNHICRSIPVLSINLQLLVTDGALLLFREPYFDAFRVVKMQAGQFSASVVLFKIGLANGASKSLSSITSGRPSGANNRGFREFWRLHYD